MRRTLLSLLLGGATAPYQRSLLDERDLPRPHPKEYVHPDDFSGPLPYHAVTSNPDADLFRNVRSGRTNEQTLRSAFERGANASAMDANGDRPLHAAIMVGNVAMVRLLLKNPPYYMHNATIAGVNDRNGTGFTPLHVAAAEGWANHIDELVQHGANLTATTPAGETALDIAYWHRNAIATQMLEELTNRTCWVFTNPIELNPRPARCGGTNVNNTPPYDLLPKGDPGRDLNHFPEYP